MSRSLLSALAVLSLLALPLATRAEDTAQKKDKASRSTCTLTAKKGDLVAQGKNLIVAGEGATRDAIAIDGDVVVRAGSTVNDVVSLRGKVTVEAGARVVGDVASIGGDVRIEKGATIAGDVLALGGQLQADEGATIAGDKTSFSMNINGEELFQKLIGGVLTGTGTRDCAVVFTEEKS
jgi:UDP-3-O-[3-hydroxymyristoyl] glucosamine N-acyltransferase